MTTTTEVIGIVGDVAVTAGAVFIAVSSIKLRRLERRARAHGRALRALIADRIGRDGETPLSAILRDEEL